MNKKEETLLSSLNNGANYSYTIGCKNEKKINRALTEERK